MDKEIKMSYSEYESMIDEIKDLKEKVERLSSDLPVVKVMYGPYDRPYSIEIVNLSEGMNIIVDKYKTNEDRLIEELREMHLIFRKLELSIKEFNEMGVLQKMFHTINY